jgi:hypothetical protein
MLQLKLTLGSRKYNASKYLIHKTDGHKGVIIAHGPTNLCNSGNKSAKPLNGIMCLTLVTFLRAGLMGSESLSTNQQHQHRLFNVRFKFSEPLSVSPSGS